MKITETRLKEIIKEEMDLHMNCGDVEMDQEGSMARRQLENLSEYALELAGMLDDNTQLESWVQSKITLAQDYISKVKHYLEEELGMDHEEHNQMGSVDAFIINDEIADSLMEE